MQHRSSRLTRKPDGNAGRRHRADPGPRRRVPVHSGCPPVGVLANQRLVDLSTFGKLTRSQKSFAQPQPCHEILRVQPRSCAERGGRVGVSSLTDLGRRRDNRSTGTNQAPSGGLVDSRSRQAGTAQGHAVAYPTLRFFRMVRILSYSLVSVFELLSCSRNEVFQPDLRQIRKLHPVRRTALEEQNRGCQKKAG